MFLQLGLLHCILVAVCDGSGALMERIVGGATTDISQMPYQIALYLNNQFTCGGSLISKNCVLTAGHCVSGRAVNTFKVRAGITHLNSVGGHTGTVMQKFVPSKFNLLALEMDVAILRLAAPLSGTNIRPIELSDRHVTASDQIQVSGWGLTDENATVVSNHLRVVTVQVISRAQCLKQYPQDLTETMFCAGAPGGGKDSCSGDSGGPAVKDGRQVGIVSWGMGCGRANYSGVYTSVKYILPWANRVMLKYCGLNQGMGFGVRHHG